MPPTIKRSQFPERLRKTKFFSHYSPFHKPADLSTVFLLIHKNVDNFHLFPSKEEVPSASGLAFIHLQASFPQPVDNSLARL